jgi:O-antigen/teichoic acid export membrane protein
MNFKRTENTTRTFAFGVINKVITLIFPFITRTIIIYTLGNDYVGLTSLFTSVLSILSVSELGISSAIAFCLYKPIAKDDRSTVNALIGLMKRLYRYIGIVVLIIGCILIPFLPYLIKGTCPSDVNIYFLYMIYLLNSVVSYFGFAYKGVLFEGYQQGDINHKISSGVEIVKYVAQIIILLQFKNYYGFALMLPASTILITVVTEIASQKMHPDIKPEGRISDEYKRIIKQKVVYLSLHSIAAKLTNPIDTIVISGALGLTAVAIYGNYQYIFSAVLAFLLIAYQAIKPALGNAFYSDTEKAKGDIFNALQLLSSWLAMWCSVCLLCLFQPFIEIWIGKSNMLSFDAVILIVLYFYSTAVRQFLTTTYISIAGLWNKTLLRQIIAAALNFILDVALVKNFGISGIVFASFFTNAFVALPMDVWIAHKHVIKDNPIQAIKKTLIDMLIAGAIAAGTYFICNVFSQTGIIDLIVKVLICIVVPNALMIIIYRKSASFAYIKRHLALMVKRIKVK